MTSTTTQHNLPNLLNCSLSDLYHGLEEGTFSSVDLVKAYLARISEVDGEFLSVIETNPDALKIAKELDKERKREGPRGLASFHPQYTSRNR